MQGRILRLVLLVGMYAVVTGCGGGSPAATLTGIAVQPHSILTWPDQVFTAVGLYSDHSTGALHAQVSWSQDAYWVRLDPAAGGTTPQIHAVCLSPAPLTGLVLPQPVGANITATATVDGQTYSAAGILYCH